MLFIEISLGICLISIGYIAGRLDRFLNSLNSQNNQILTRHVATNLNKKIEIDDTKFVTQLDTEKYERGFNKLGDSKISNDDVGSAVDKLSRLKGK